MARLHEYQGKAILAEHGIAVPRGRVARSPAEAAAAAEELGGAVVLKVQAWITGRAAKGGIAFAHSPEEAQAATERLLAMRFGNFPVSELLIEEKIDIRDELFVSLSIDDVTKSPVLLLDPRGGSGIEERAESVARISIDVRTGISTDRIRESLASSPIDPSLHESLAQVIAKVPEIAKAVEARSLEINPLVTTNDGRILAADCRVTIDDYAVFRHPELGIEIARELDHPPTELERIAYRIEQEDHRGTFYFAQLPTGGAERSKGLIGFHGAGGGGSMMSMDAVTQSGFTLANFCDTSGNPSAAKVYRAARIILAQPGIVGYFGSGSGVASQEQFWSAYGLAKAFLELNMTIPAVIRLGGNSEDRAVEILEDACRDLPAKVEGYKKDDAPRKCAERFAELVQQSGGMVWDGASVNRTVPAFVGSADAMMVALPGGAVWIDTERCDAEANALVVKHSYGLFREDDGCLTLAVSEDELAGKDSELIACEIECRRAGKPVVFVDLPIAGVDVDARKAVSLEEAGSR